MAGLNRIILVGRLTADPELRYTVDGTPMGKFSLAVDRDYKTDETHQVDFIPIIAWRKLAEICGEYLKKGRLVLIEGKIQVRSYETQAGARRWVTEVVARNMQMLGQPSGGQAKAAVAASVVEETPELSEVPVPSVPDEEDLPF